eukprot:1166563-Pyramimonas_sp.AAC.1
MMTLSNVLFRAFDIFAGSLEGSLDPSKRAAATGQLVNWSIGQNSTSLGVSDFDLRKSSPIGVTRDWQARRWQVDTTFLLHACKKPPNLANNATTV